MTISDYIEKWGSLKPSLKENASLLLGVVGLFGWLGITPEIAGQGLYTLVRFAVPVIEFPLGAFFMYSMLTRKHIVEKRDLETLISQTEGKVQLLSEEVNRMTKKNESLASKMDEMEKEKIRPDFGCLSKEEKAMVCCAYGTGEPFPTPGTSVFTYPDITLYQLQKRNIVDQVSVKKIDLTAIDMWQIARSAKEALDNDDGLLEQCRNAYSSLRDAALERREEEKRRAEEGTLSEYSYRLSQIDITSRALLRALILGYDVFCLSSHWSNDVYEHDLLLCNLVEWECDSDITVKFNPTQLLIDVYRYKPELFEGSVDDCLLNRENVPNGWRGNGLSSDIRFEFPWWWEKRKGDCDA